jgi:hypothetical protein
MSDMRELYQEVILDHNKRPRNCYVMDCATRTADGHNPLCGDIVKVYLRNASEAARVTQDLHRRLGPSVPVLVLAADICRSDLLIEIEVVHRG